MGVTVEVTSEPSCKPVTIAEAKRQLRVDTSADDSVIERLIRTARKTVERRANVSLITQTRKVYFDEWHEVLQLPYGPVQSVSSIEYVDTDGTTETVDSSTYRVDLTSRVPRITEAYGEVWPTKRSVTNSAWVTYTAGWGDNPDDVPEEARAAVFALVTHWYEYRQPVMTEGVPRDVPMSIDSQIAGLRVHGSLSQE